MSSLTTQLPTLLFIPHSTTLTHAVYFGEVQQENGSWRKAGFAIEKPEDAPQAIGFYPVTAFRVRDVHGTILVEGIAQFLRTAS